MFKYLLLTSLFATEQTLSILKPDALEQDHVGEIQSYLESSGLHIIASKMVELTPEQAAAFYADQKDRPFYPDLLAYMTRGPILVQVLEGEDAIFRNRQIMGATDPSKAAPGTIRADFGTDIQQN